MLSPNLARRAVAAARAFEAKQYWLRFGNEDALAFELPDEPHPVYATILGAAGQHFGMSLYRGERALDQLRQVTTTSRPAFVATMLVLSFDPPGAVPPERRMLATAAGVSDRIIPVFFGVDPGMRNRDPRNTDLRCLIAVLDAIALAEARGLLKPRRFQPHRACNLLTLAVTGGGREPDVTARYQEVPGPTAGPGIALPWPMPELPLVADHWVIGLEPAPIEVAGNPARPFFLIAADADNGYLHDLRVVVVEGSDLEDIAQELADVFGDHRATGDRGIPRHLTFVHQGLHAALAAPLTEFGVTVELVDEHPVVAGIVQSYRDRLAERDPERDPEQVPAADDTEAWRRLHANLFHRMKEDKHAAGLDSQKALAAFFGDADALERLEAADANVPRSAYEQWFLVAYRGKGTRRTRAERLLDKPLAAPERLLLQAGIAARTGIYRVVRIQAPLVVLADILSDYETDVLDGGLATSVEVDRLLPCRIADAAGHRFVIPVGPMLEPFLLDSAIQHLQRRGHTVTSAALQQHWEPLAHLWTWALDLARPQPTITNGDGHRIALQTATFQVSDASSLQQVLTDRKDIEPVDPDKWAWQRDDGKGATMLGFFELLDGELLLTTNSEERLAAARSWLEAVPGVTFSHSVPIDQQRGPDAEREPAIDPASLPPEALQQVQAHLDRRYLGWIDEPIPMLGNQTPRQASRTPAGREQVLRLIRSMPEPGGMPGIVVPRARMRRELGLEAE